MKASNIKRHLAKLGVTMDKIIPPRDRQRWSTTLHGSAPETTTFPNASHALRYWDARSRAQVPLLLALEARVRSGMNLDDIKALEDWALGNKPWPHFIESAFTAPPSLAHWLRPQDIARLCAIYGPISAPWIKSFVALAKAHARRDNEIDSDPKWIWGATNESEEGE